MVPVEAGGIPYPVLVGRGLLGRLPGILARFAPGHRYAFVCDSTTAPLYGHAAVAACRREGLTADAFSFPAGEASKTRETWALLTDALLRAGVGRDGVVVAVGGGVVGDLAGFVAATYMRGVPVVQVPTTLMAMIDSSVGGKTGVDVEAGKNLVGAFHPPRVVVVDAEAARTLSVAQRADGLAEALKHGAIADRSYLDRLLDQVDGLLGGDVEMTENAVLRSVEIKAEVVSLDERESGPRQILNFGHTVGHALEAESGYAGGHGAFVAAGMLLEARLGERVGVTAPGTSEELASMLRAFGLGDVPGGTADVEGVLRRLGADKKTRGGRVRFVLLERLGVVARGDGWSHDVDPALVRSVLEDAGRGG